MDLKRAVAGVLFSIGVATTAHAAPVLPAPSTFAECVANGTVQDDAASCLLSSGSAAASGSIVLWPFVTLTASSTTSPGGGSGVLVDATYSFQVVGGNPGDIVPIMISTNLSSDASSLDHAFAMAQTRVDTSAGSFTEIVCTNGSINPTCPTLNTTFSGSFAWSALSGESGDTIHLAIEAQSGDSAVPEWANASLDPFIFIDPNFANAASYSIIVSPGVGNGLPVSTVPVPEPGTIALTASGLIMLISRGSRARHLRSPALR
jgi:hypothetical protein